MHFKTPLSATNSYRQTLEELERIMDELVNADREHIEETFNYYADRVNCDEAAAILTLAEVLKGRERQSAAQIELVTPEHLTQ